MKLYKLFLILFAAVCFTACSDDDEVKNNTAAGVTVEFATDSLKTKEGRGIARIPVILNGDPNGKVKVTIEVTEVTGSDDPAIEDEHYYVTTKSLWIYPDEKEAFFEINALDDGRHQNETRCFIIKITSVENATLGARSQAIGAIADNDTLPYDILQGEWTLSSVNGDGDVEIPFTLTGYLDDDYRFERLLIAEGDWLGFGSDTINVYFNKGGNYVSIAAGCKIAAGLNFGSNTGTCDIYTAVGGASSPVLNGSIPGNWNTDYTEVDFGNNMLYFLVVSDENNTVVGPNVTVGIYDSWSSIRFVRSLEEE